MKNKVISLSRARLARMTTEERAERRQAQRHYREAIRTNECYEKQQREALQEAVLTKIQDQLRDEIFLSCPDPMALTMREITVRTNAAAEALKNSDTGRAAVKRALDALEIERPEPFTRPGIKVPPKPADF